MAETEHPVEERVLCESAIPQVAFDIRLGRTLRAGETVEFDYPTYTALLRERGLSDEAINATQVFIQSGRWYSLRVGRYISGEGPVMACYGPWVNRALIHKTEHRIDDYAGWLNEGAVNTVVANMGQLALKAAIITEGLSWTLLATHHPYAASGMFGVTGIETAAWMAGIVAYLLDPKERRARQAVRRGAPEIVYVSGPNGTNPDSCPQQTLIRGNAIDLMRL